MKIRLVQLGVAGFVINEFADAEEAVAAFAARGFTFIKNNRNDRHRAELQGAPVFAQLHGPMWHGDAIRYEDPEANDILSA
jgi:hypothetical protein